jgi:acylphosphatase
MKRRVSFHVTGRVQGVAYRMTAREEADRLALGGWIRNEADGSVSGMVEGEASNVDAFLAWCKRGPMGARVEGVHISDHTFYGETKRFEIRR